MSCQPCGLSAAEVGRCGIMICCFRRARGAGSRGGGEPRWLGSGIGLRGLGGM